MKTHSKTLLCNGKSNEKRKSGSFAFTGRSSSQAIEPKHTTSESEELPEVYEAEDLDETK